MSQKKFVGLIGLLLVVGLFYWFSRAQEEQQLAKPATRFFADVDSEAVREVHLSRGDKRVVLRRGDDAWTLPERDGYPADPGKLRSLLVQLFELKSSQQITDRPEHHARLGVDEASVEQGKAKIELRDKDSTVIGSLYVGEMRRSRSRETLPGLSGQYARRGESDVVYLIGDRVPVNANITNWLLRSLANILPKGIVKLVHYTKGTDGFEESYTLVQVQKEMPESPGPQKPQFALGDESGEVLTSVPALQVQSGLENMRIVDVRKLEGAPEDIVFDQRTDYWLKNGLRYSVTTAEKDGKYYGTISVSFEPLADEPAVPPESGQEESEDKNPDVSTAEEAQKLNEQYGPWMYEFPKYLGQKFRVDRSAMVKKEAQ